MRKFSKVSARHTLRETKATKIRGRASTGNLSSRVRSFDFVLMSARDLFTLLCTGSEDDDPLESVEETEHGIIDVQFYPLRVESYKFRRWSRSIDISAVSSANTKLRCKDWKKQATHAIG